MARQTKDKRNNRNTTSSIWSKSKALRKHAVKRRSKSVYIGVTNSGRWQLLRRKLGFKNDVEFASHLLDCVNGKTSAEVMSEKECKEDENNENEVKNTKLETEEETSDSTQSQPLETSDDNEWRPSGTPSTENPLRRSPRTQITPTRLYVRRSGRKPENGSGSQKGSDHKRHRKEKPEDVSDSSLPVNSPIVLIKDIVTNEPEREMPILLPETEQVITTTIVPTKIKTKSHTKRKFKGSFSRRKSLKMKKREEVKKRAKSKNSKKKTILTEEEKAEEEKGKGEEVEKEKEKEDRKEERKEERREENDNNEIKEENNFELSLNIDVKAEGIENKEEIQTKRKKRKHGLTKGIKKQDGGKQKIRKKNRKHSLHHKSKRDRDIRRAPDGGIPINSYILPPVLTPSNIENSTPVVETKTIEIEPDQPQKRVSIKIKLCNDCNCRHVQDACPVQNPLHTVFDNKRIVPGTTSLLPDLEENSDSPEEPLPMKIDNNHSENNNNNSDDTSASGDRSNDADKSELKVLKPPSVAEISLPIDLLTLEKRDGFHGLSVVAKCKIERYTRFGPLVGEIIKEKDIPDDFSMKGIWEVCCPSDKFYLSTMDPDRSNWMRFIRPAPTRAERNLAPYIENSQLFFVTTVELVAGSELLFWLDDPSNAWAKKKLEKTSCGGCNLRFTHPLYYRLHCVVFHDANFSLTIRKYHCKVCGLVVLGKENIMKHAADNHEGKGAYQCQFCKKFFLRLNYLEMHRTYGCAENPHRARPLCDFCGRKFCQPQKLKVHIKRMHSVHLHGKSGRGKDITEVLREFQCKMCLKLLGSRAALQRHMKEVHQKDMVGSCTCDRCGKMFQNKSNLKIHMLTHSGVKPFRCQDPSGCSAAFTTKQCLQFHYKKVHGMAEESIPSIKRCIDYTFDAYSGGAVRDPGRGKIPKVLDEKSVDGDKAMGDSDADSLSGVTGDESNESSFPAAPGSAPPDLAKAKNETSPEATPPSQPHSHSNSLDSYLTNFPTNRILSKASKKWMADMPMQTTIVNYDALTPPTPPPADIDQQESDDRLQDESLPGDDSRSYEHMKTDGPDARDVYAFDDKNDDVTSPLLPPSRFSSAISDNSNRNIRRNSEGTAALLVEAALDAAEKVLLPPSTTQEDPPCLSPVDTSPQQQQQSHFPATSYASLLNASSSSPISIRSRSVISCNDVTDDMSPPTLHAEGRLPPMRPPTKSDNNMTMEMGVGLDMSYKGYCHPHDRSAQLLSDAEVEMALSQRSCGPHHQQGPQTPMDMESQQHQQQRHEEDYRTSCRSPFMDSGSGNEQGLDMSRAYGGFLRHEAFQIQQDMSRVQSPFESDRSMDLSLGGRSSGNVAISSYASEITRPHYPHQILHPHHSMDLSIPRGHHQLHEIDMIGRGGMSPVSPPPTPGPSPPPTYHHPHSHHPSVSPLEHMARIISPPSDMSRIMSTSSAPDSRRMMTSPPLTYQNYPVCPSPYHLPPRTAHIPSPAPPTYHHYPGYY